MKIKLCGFTETKSLQQAIDEGADFVGFVFCKKSPRNLEISSAESLAKIVPQNIAKVAVVVDEKIEFLQEIYNAVKPQYWQLHGSETVARIIEIKNAFPDVKIIKAIAVENEKNIKQSLDFIDLVDFLLFDAKIAGSGKSWDFSMLKNFKCEKNWFLSGGLNINNILQAVENSGAKMVDVSSGIEEIRGVKSPKLIAEFMRKIKNEC